MAPFVETARKPTLDDILIRAGIIDPAETEQDILFCEPIKSRIGAIALRVELHNYLQDLAALLLLQKSGQVDLSQKLEEQEERFEVLGLDKTGLWLGDLKRQIQTAIDEMFPAKGRRR